MQPEPSSQEGKCQESPSHDFVLPKFRTPIPAPKTGNWMESYGSWEGFCQAIQRSTGRNLGRGVVTFCDD
jgi:hypothetical protein